MTFVFGIEENNKLLSFSSLIVDSFIGAVQTKHEQMHASFSMIFRFETGSILQGNQHHAPEVRYVGRLSSAVTNVHFRKGDA